MPVTIRVHEDVVSLFERYGRWRPAMIAPMMERILDTWTQQAAKKWLENPKLIPKLEVLGDSKTVSIELHHGIGKSFLLTLAELNRRLTEEKKISEPLNPDELATWLAYQFIKMFGIKVMVEKRKKMLKRTSYN